MKKTKCKHKMAPSKEQLQREIAIRRERLNYAKFKQMREYKRLFMMVLHEMVMNLDYAKFDYE